MSDQPLDTGLTAQRLPLTSHLRFIIGFIVGLAALFALMMRFDLALALYLGSLPISLVTDLWEAHRGGVPLWRAGLLVPLCPFSAAILRRWNARARSRPS